MMALLPRRRVLLLALLAGGCVRAQAGPPHEPGRIIQRPWVVDGQVVPRQMTELTLAFDHRVCDGGTAGGFLRFIADCVESPAKALRHL